MGRGSGARYNMGKDYSSPPIRRWSKSSLEIAYEIQEERAIKYEMMEDGICKNCQDFIGKKAVMYGDCYIVCETSLEDCAFKKMNPDGHIFIPPDEDFITMENITEVFDEEEMADPQEELFRRMEKFRRRRQKYGNGFI